MLRWRTLFCLFSQRTEGMVRLAPQRFSCAATLFAVGGKSCAGSFSPQPETKGVVSPPAIFLSSYGAGSLFFWRAFIFFEGVYVLISS